MPARINYVVAAYLGDRKFMDGAFLADRWHYLRAQVEMLRRLRHNLDQITFVINTNVPLTVPEDIKAAGVVVQRPNRGMSYGAWSDAYAASRGKFTHYIFNEDDYLFTQQDFDRLLLDEFTKRPGVQMLCGAAYPIASFPTHPAVSCMIAGTLGLEASFRKGGMLPNFSPAGTAESPYPHGYQSQMRFSEHILSSGYKLEDWLLRWSTAFRMDGAPSLTTRWFSRRGNATINPHAVEADFSVPTMVVGVQTMNLLHPIHNGFGTREGTILPDGTVNWS